MVNLPLGTRTGFHFMDDVPDWKLRKIRNTLRDAIRYGNPRRYIHCPTVEYNESIRAQLRNLPRGVVRGMASRGRMMTTRNAVLYIARHYVKPRFYSTFLADYADLILNV